MSIREYSENLESVSNKVQILQNKKRVLVKQNIILKEKK